MLTLTLIRLLTDSANFIFPLFYSSLVQVYSKCKINEFTIQDASGHVSCIKCGSCPPGYGLFPQCGDIIKQSDIKIECRRCQLGKTYSATNDISSCRPCEICSKHQTVERNCTLNSNSKCNDTCTSDFYYEELTGDCQPCSWCCGSESTVKTQCKNMPSYQQCDVNNKNCKPKCQKGQYIVADKNGGHCEDCKDCPAGTSPFPKCGSVVESTTNIKCLKCVAGETFSDEQGRSPCRACSKCTFGQKELVPCNLTNDRVCGECDKGFYKDDISNQCKPCSGCCNDIEDVRVKKCSEQKMPENLQCSYTKRAISVCQQQRNQEPTDLESKRALVVYVAAGLAVGLVTSVLAMLYWKLKYRRKYQRLSTHHSVAFLPGTEEEGKV